MGAVICEPVFLAEGVGFEPTRACALTDFKSAAFIHSALPRTISSNCKTPVTPNDFTGLAEVEHRLLVFHERYEQIATPFEWRFTRNDRTYESQH